MSRRQLTGPFDVSVSGPCRETQGADLHDDSIHDGTTHAVGCHAWGPRHYECALREIERLRAALYKIASPLTVWPARTDDGNPQQDCAREALQLLNAETARHPEYLAGRLGHTSWCVHITNPKGTAACNCGASFPNSASADAGSGEPKWSK